MCAEVAASYPKPIKSQQGIGASNSIRSADHVAFRPVSCCQCDVGKMLSLVRTCAPTDMGWDCERGRTKGGHQMEVCHDTCTWDGCNHARSTAASALVVVTTALLTNVLLL
ncbi:hypothetical protein E2C01_018322 [Portunus trituberculatus]|uniref:Protein quiver n=1 Tax=Portunus trituberculatus TaxID=210409 RepID=A0A5B7DVT9_PORTR|nr:hypothetical protein [Portunus trituberculatus]